MPSAVLSSDALVHHVALLLQAGTSPEELGRVVDERGSELARLLGIREDELHTLSHLENVTSARRLRDLVSAYGVATRQQKRFRRENLAVAAAGMLSRLARWDDGRIELHRDIILGPNIVPPSARFIRFAPEGREPVVVQARDLRRARRCLRQLDGLAVCLDDALTFAWKDGRGRLRLAHRLRIPRESRAHVFTVVLDAPRPAARRSAGAWLGQVLGEIGFAP